MTILVTGGTGFIGRHLIEVLSRGTKKVRVACRRGTEANFFDDRLEIVYLSGLGTDVTDWAEAVADCSTVIHLAARAHVLRDQSEDPVEAFRIANVDFTRACAEAAANSGVRRFIFLSSAGVHGGSSGAKPFNENSPFMPHTAYARSKVEAEMVLTQFASRSCMDLVIIRAPLVYGPKAPGNFGILVRAIECGLPLPFGSITINRRSFVAIDNLLDLIVTCVEHPAAVNQVFLVSDGNDISTADLLLRLGATIGKPARLIPVPVSWLGFGLKLLGKKELFQSLCGSFQLDISKTCTLLDWKPPVSLDEGLRKGI